MLSVHKTVVRNKLKNSYSGKFYSAEELKLLIDETAESVKSEKNGTGEFIFQYVHYNSKKQKYKIDTRKKQSTSGYTEFCSLTQKTEEEELALLEAELEGKTINMTTNYVFPIEKQYNYIERKGDKYAPFGSGWVHGQQFDDKWSDVLEKRAEQYDKLRSVTLPEQRSDGWFKMRSQKITASDGATVLNLNKYDPQYSFILKKTVGVPFTSNKYCYHGKKYEEPATMVYKYRMNVDVEEFGLMGHPKYSFLGASPDGICSRYKYDKKSRSKYVGRMLEIKCPLSRDIKTEGDIKGDICPIYYWIQVQLQLECCDLEECDFWQCSVYEYSSREEFISDTDEDEPFRSSTTGFEKGVLIQILPKKKINDKYWSTVYDDAQFIYPDRIDMTPHECDMWVAKSIVSMQSNPKYFDYVVDKVLYWRLNKTHNVVVKRDREWFAESLPLYKKMWDYVVFFRNNKEALDKLVSYIESLNVKKNSKIMDVVEQLYDDKFTDEQLIDEQLVNKQLTDEDDLEHCIFIDT